MSLFLGRCLKGDELVTCACANIHVSSHGSAKDKRHESSSQINQIKLTGRGSEKDIRRAQRYLTNVPHSPSYYRGVRTSNEFESSGSSFLPSNGEL